jgi:hypothetical protein
MIGHRNVRHATTTRLLSDQQPLRQVLCAGVQGIPHSTSHPNLALQLNQTSPTQPVNNSMSPSTLASSISSQTLALLQNQLNHHVPRGSLRSVASVGNLSDMDTRMGGASFYQVESLVDM